MAAVVLYGSTYVPIKRIETGDGKWKKSSVRFIFLHLMQNFFIFFFFFVGMFYHFVSCASIWVVSLFGDLLLRTPKFHPLAMLGGMIWATGIVSGNHNLKQKKTKNLFLQCGIIWCRRWAQDMKQEAFYCSQSKTSWSLL